MTNPGFDQNTGGWQVTNTAGSTGARVASEDASKCPYSGALAITSASDSGAETTFSQCVNLGSNGATLNVGLQWKVLANSPGNAGIVCRATLTGDSNCAVTANDPGMTLIMSDEYPPLNAWSGYQPGSPNFGIRGTVANPGSFTHLLLSCQGRNGIAVDMAYVNTAAAAY